MFASDLLLASGLIVLAFKLQIVERDMLATLDRGAMERLATSREMRAERNVRGGLGDTLGHDATAQRQPLPRTV
ncbi:hypothetical protein PQR33_24650 [Paraburkholderia sediminicola]|uniref:hypothetical protein n=1 Tax=Paraburkholderia sediminicola TaxID=458836 RepID=UPI0038BBCD25